MEKSSHYNWQSGKCVRIIQENEKVTALCVANGFLFASAFDKHVRKYDIKVGNIFNALIQIPYSPVRVCMHSSACHPFKVWLQLQISCFVVVLMGPCTNGITKYLVCQWKELKYLKEWRINSRHAWPQ